MRITSTELESWGSTRDAQGKLPLLLRKLITNSVDKYIPHIDIPAEDSIWKPGMDGIVQTTSDSVLGEAGVYNIECGINENYKDKFFSDLKKRSANLQKKTDTIFVFVTTKKIQDKDKLLNKARQDIVNSNLWKSIKVFDADNMEHWLEQDYATAAWMCNVLGKPSDGIYDFDKKWSEWCKSTIIPLDEQIILARENIHEKEMNNWLLYDKGLLEVKSNSKKESLLFLLASILKIANQEKREEIKSKVLIVEDNSQWKRIVDNKHSENLILVPMFGIPDGIAVLKDKNYQIYFPLSSTDVFQINNRIELKNVNNYLLEPILNQKIKDYRFQNSLHQRFSDGSLLLLQQLLKRKDTPLPKPDWVSKENSELLLFLSMFSSWDNSNSKDIGVVEAVLNKSYSDIKKIIISMISVEGAPIQQINNNIQVTNPELILDYMSTYIVPEFFDTLLNKIKDILSEIDKNYDEENKNFLYNFSLDKTETKYSSNIKSSVSQGLALFSNYTDYTDNNATIRSKISQMIKSIFEDCDYKLWMSLNHYMQPLFEAAPDEMLRQVDKLFENDNFILNNMIANSGVYFGGDCFYAGVLNGLESIAWVPEYLHKTTNILLKMGENWQNGSNYSNSPMDSLRKIYCAWSPQTAANIVQRKDVIASFINQNKYIEAVETLLNNLQFRPNDTILLSNRPMYLQINETPVIDQGIKEFYDFVFDKLLQIVEITHHWNLLIDNCFNLPQAQQQILIDKLRSIDYETYSYEDNLNIKKAILSKTQWFDEYGKDNDEDIDIPFINELKNIDNSIKFTEKYQNYLSLFEIYSFKDDNKPYIDALVDILNSDGVKGILKLIKSVKDNKYKLYEGLSKISLSETQLKQFIDALDQDKNIDEVMSMFIGRYFYNKEQEFLDIFWKETWSTELKKNILKYLNPSLNLWKWIEQHHLDSLYWTGMHIYQDFKEEEFNYAKDKIANYDSDMLLEFVFYHLQIATSDDILNALLIYQKTENNTMDCHYIDQLFNKLYESDVDSSNLIKLEIKYSDILTAYNKPFPIHLKKELANPDSPLFSEIISEVYLQDSLSKDETKNINAQKKSEEQIHAQKLALKLMMKIESSFIFDDCSDNIIPWFEKNKKRLLNVDRFNSGMSVIGQLFGRSPKDETDNIWPLKAIRDIIEKEENDDLDRAICIGKYNSIGVRSVTPQATDMWNAYNEYKEYADKLRYSYNRTATILDNIAEDYKRNAQDDENSYKRRYL